MQIIAEKRVLELSEGNIETTKAVFAVEPGETVEALLVRVGMSGASRWHYDQTEVRLKLVTPNCGSVHGVQRRLRTSGGVFGAR